tara:strand:- start:625 stop:756 length:132 start_codon:yes stop_codon:yes gene_type:complete
MRTTRRLFLCKNNASTKQKEIHMPGPGKKKKPKKKPIKKPIRY